jgi:hypothetical protein
VNILKNKTLEEICQQISYIYNNRVPTDLKELEELFVRFTKLLFMKTFNIDREPVVKVTDEDKYAGCYNGHAIFSINRGLLNDFMNGKALDLFETICHELSHFYQKLGAKNINIKNATIEKDSYLKRKIKGYYDQNYDFLMVEVESFLSQNKEAMDILNILGIKPSEEEIAFSKQIRDEYSKNIMIMGRVVGDDAYDIDELYESILVVDSKTMDDFDKNNFLEFNPCTNIEYKINDERIVKRSRKELEEIYSSYTDGKIQLPGVSSEIEVYFKYIIEKAKFKEESVTSSKK